MKELEITPQLERVGLLVQNGNLKGALDELLALEKKTRQVEDVVLNTKVILMTIQLCFNNGRFDLMNEYIVAFSKKHGLLRQAISKLVNSAMGYICQINDPAEKFKFLKVLHSVAEGKIFLEIERARITRIIAKIEEDNGNFLEALNLLSKLQVETFSSMDKKEKTEFFLEQMRLAMINKDYISVFITSKNINLKVFQDEECAGLKMKFYDIMIKRAIHENDYIEICKNYRHIYDTKMIIEDNCVWPDILKNCVVFVVLAPYSNDQYDLLHRIYQELYLSKMPEFKSFLKCFVTNEIIRWPKMRELFTPTLMTNQYFAPTYEKAEHFWKELHIRVTEHNIRVIAHAYECINLYRLAELLDLDIDAAQEALSKLVVNKTIYARIDCPLGIVSFQSPKSMDSVLNEWSANIQAVLNLIFKTNHLITKEEMVHNAVKIKQ